MKKRLIKNQPNFNDLSQYNFNDDETNFDYENSTGLPKNRDKFTKKDLYTQSIGDELNEKIIDGNLKFEGASYIRIDKLKIRNAGVNYPIRGVDIRGFLFSKKRLNPFANGSNLRSYDSILNDLYPNNEINDSQSPGFFRFTPGTYSENGSPGNLDFLEGSIILENFQNNIDPNNYHSDDVPTIPFGENGQGFLNSVNTEYDIRNSLELSSTTPEDLTTHVFDEYDDNPIYFALWMKGDADRWWGTDKRKRRIQIFEINNLDLFEYDDNGNVTSGKAVSLTFQNSDSYKVTGGGGGGGAEAAAFLVDSLNVTITTLPGGQNDFPSLGEYVEFTDKVLPPVTFEPNESNPLSFLEIGPDRQLSNFNLSGWQDLSGTFTNVPDDEIGKQYFPDFFPKTHVVILGQDGNPDFENLTDLQSYYEDDKILSIKSSAPSTIGYSITPKSIDDGDDTTLSDNIGGTGYEATTFYHYVLSWNDTDNEIKTLQDALENRPDNLFDLLNLQNQNLYKLERASTDIFLTSSSILKYIRDNYDRDEILNIANEVINWVGNAVSGMSYILQFSQFLEKFLDREQDLGMAQFIEEETTASRVGFRGLSTEEAQIEYLAYGLYIAGVLTDDFNNSPYPSITEGLGISEELYKLIQETTGIGEISNTYTTPGIKTIKVVAFSYDEQSEQVGRWKLITIKFYLDIPINQYPDFDTLGGSEYTTIPWPYTTPIIGGVSEDSKYKKSVRNVLGSGKISDNDIINERFLNNDIDNDEMGESINKMDLEQCRYFNKSYNMNDLLGITEPYFNSTSPSYLATLPFPYYLEEFDIDGSGAFSSADVSRWISPPRGAIRPDISEFILRILGFSGGMSTISESQYIYPDYVFDWVDEFSIPIGGGDEQPVEYFYNPSPPYVATPLEYPYYDILGSLTQIDGHWNGVRNKFSEETSVGQIFIGDNLDLNLKQSCKLEFNTGQLSGKTIIDSSGNSNKGILIGDYKVKKNRKEQPMIRDTYIKIPKKANKRRGAL